MARRNLDLDDLDCVSGGLNMRSLQNHLDHDLSPNPVGNGANPLNNALLGGPAVGGAVPAGLTPIDASQGQFFDPFGAPGHPAAVAGPQHGAFPSAVPHFPGMPAPHGPQAQGPNYLNAIPGVIGALGQVGSNPLGAIGGVLGALGGAQGQGSPLGAIGGILGSLGRGASGGNPLGALGGLFGGGGSQGGGNPLGGLGNLFGGGGGAPQGGGGAPQGGDDFGGGDFGGGDFGGGDFGGF